MHNGQHAIKIKRFCANMLLPHGNLAQRNTKKSVYFGPFKLQITASVRERPLRATRAPKAAPTLSAEAVCKRTTFVVSETGLCYRE